LNSVESNQNSCCASAYYRNGKLDLGSSYAPITECSVECACDQEKCLNRLVQRGCSFTLSVIDCEAQTKGQGLIADEPIAAGSFVIEYLGEIIGANHAEQLRQARTRSGERNYIMYLNEHYAHESRTVTTIIDARNYSNLARYINHSCEPNLFILPIRVNNVVPHAALFAIRDILRGEELCYDYDGASGSAKILSSSMSTNACYCGSANCRGYLP
jgi:[histone H3]-lysine36 N-dimethyltransferase SETMAR